MCKLVIIKLQLQLYYFTHLFYSLIQHLCIKHLIQVKTRKNSLENLLQTGVVLPAYRRLAESLNYSAVCNS